MRTRLAPVERRRQLVETAMGLFADRAYDGVGLDDVAAAADVRRSLLYRYFPAGKPDLHLAVVEEAWGRLVARVDTDPGRPLADKTPGNVGTFLDLAATGDPAFRVVAQARHAADPRVRRLARRARRRWARAMARNHLGRDDVPEPVLAALTGYLAYAETVVEEWRVHRAITRAQAQTLLTDPLAGILAAAQ
jgi:AcrR family transcriptional regulator